MSYKELYDHCQGFGAPVHRNSIKDKVLALSGLPTIAVAHTTLDTTVCRGLYLSARNSNHRIVQQMGGHVICIARGLNRCWTRFVYTKELMHVFDDPDEASDTGDDFDRQLADFSGPSSPTRSPQFISEVKAFWMALGVLCPETTRLQLEEDRKDGKIDDYAIALRFLIPEQYVPRIFQDDYLGIMQLFLT